jgi:hypothetical protein
MKSQTSPKKFEKNLQIKQYEIASIKWKPTFWLLGLSLVKTWYKQEFPSTAYCSWKLGTKVLIHPPWHAAQWHWITQGQIPYAAKSHEYVCLVCMSSLMQATRNHAVKNLRHPLQMSPVTLSLLCPNVRHHFATSHMDITGYTLAQSVHAYRLLTIHVPQKVCNFLGFKARPVFQVGHHDQLPELCSFCTYALKHIHEHYSPVILISTAAEISSSTCWKLFFYLPLY